MEQQDRSQQQENPMKDYDSTERNFDDSVPDKRGKSKVSTPERDDENTQDTRLKGKNLHSKLNEDSDETKKEEI